MSVPVTLAGSLKRGIIMKKPTGTPSGTHPIIVMLTESTRAPGNRVFIRTGQIHAVISLIQIIPA